ncbi:MAG TPA: tagatose-6-phosphate ketose isomerase, partial [Streptococcus parasuis]|nr:tagatose-6-phosphate ketose isomerase [Streptococcus parasuis]
MGASITAKEIFQQPGLWQEAYQLYVSQLEAVESFLSGIKEKHDLI